MNTVEYIAFHKEACEKMHQIMKDKNSDYCGDNDTPFSNVEYVEKTGVCMTEIGILTRMSDKFARLNSFIKKGMYKVKSESFEDSCLDLANYAIMMAAYFKHKSDRRKSPPPLPLDIGHPPGCSGSSIVVSASTRPSWIPWENKE